jgi:hypothetical protein
MIRNILIRKLIWSKKVRLVTLEFHVTYADHVTKTVGRTSQSRQFRPYLAIWQKRQLTDRNILSSYSRNLSSSLWAHKVGILNILLITTFMLKKCR